MNEHTTSSGMPIKSNEVRDQILEHHLLTEKLAYFNREKIPERITHAKGAGAYGVFTVTKDITKFTKARIFSEIGKNTPEFVRFSNYRGEKGSQLYFTRKRVIGILREIIFQFFILGMHGNFPI